MNLTTVFTTKYASSTRRKLGISPSELRLMLAILSHEAAFGESPTRAALVEFLGLQPNGYRLMQMGWILSSELYPVAGVRSVMWRSSKQARGVLLGCAQVVRSA